MSKLKVVLLCIICISLYSCVFSELTKAEQSKISFEDVSYYCYSYKPSPGIYHYYINVTLSYTGDVPSNETTIKIFEDDFSVVWPEEYRNVVFQPGESKEFTLDWSTGIASKEIEIKWMPSSLNEIHTIYNSGSKNVTITHDSVKTDNNTPGFEIPIVISALFLTIIIMNIKRKKY